MHVCRSLTLEKGVYTRKFLILDVMASHARKRLRTEGESLAIIATSSSQNKTINRRQKSFAKNAKNNCSK